MFANRRRFRVLQKIEVKKVDDEVSVISSDHNNYMNSSVIMESAAADTTFHRTYFWFLRRLVLGSSVVG